MINPFIRQIEVNIFPNYLKGGSNPSWQAKSDGSANSLRIQFAVARHIRSTSTPTEIRLFNLKEDTRQFLSSQSKGWVQIKVGYRNTTLVDLYQGSLTSVLSDRNGVDIITTLFCSDATDEARKQIFNMSQSTGVKKIDVSNMNDTTVYAWINALSNEIPGVQFAEQNIKTKLKSTETKLPKGYSTSGKSAFAILDDLSRRYGFSWHISNGLFYLTDDNEQYDIFFEVSAANGMLKRAEPGLISRLYREDKLATMNIHSLLLPQLIPGMGVKLVSKFNTQFNRVYKAFGINHVGDSHGETWDTHTEALVIQGG